MATTRSAMRPTTRKTPSSSPTVKPLLGGPVHHDEPSVPRGCAGLLDQAGERPRGAVEPSWVTPRSAGRRTAPSGDVDLGADDQPGPLQQLGLVAAELVEQHPLLLGRRAALRPRPGRAAAPAPGPLDVAEELVAEAPALRGRPSMRPGDVGDDELVLVEADDAEVRLERGEGVVGDLRLGRAELAEIRGRLPGVREADEGGVGDELQLEAEPALLAVLALLGEARRPPGVGQEAGVAPARPGRRGRRGTSRRGGRGRRGPSPSRSRTIVPSGTATTEVDAGAAGALVARAVGAGGGPAVGVVAEGEQRGDVAVGPEPDVAALAAVAAVGAALRDVGLPPERDRAGAAVATAQVDLARSTKDDMRDRWIGGRGRADLRRLARRRSRPGGPPEATRREDVDEPAAAAVAELHHAVGGGEERVVAAPADVLAGVELRAALADDDRAGGDGRCRRTPSRRGAGRGVTAVAGGRGTLLLRHVARS